ncbi:multidrug effflux MFS transporter [uncultured Tolumonas sp.]|uniref:multidrug effflux MFS transporter n=1 Tax=uncultured Tolumonas sp. TaxID=263765 RepID=UPI00292D3F64|nr:multidrug effflux MFS transporter [uncultured Tolumonas sp.]
MSRSGIPVTSPFYVVMLGLMSALPPFGIDVGLPALPNLQTDLGVTMAQATQTLTLFLVGFAFGPVLFGPLSDRYGRKPILLFGVAIFSLAALGCAMARSIELFLILRVIQGIGAGAAAALPAAIVRDVFSGDMAINRQSYVAVVNAVTPLVAPLIGAAIISIGTWHSIYQALAVIGTILFVSVLFGYRETAPRQPVQGNIIRSTIHAYVQVLSNRDYVLATGLFAATFGIMFAYISSSSSVFMNVLGVSASTYGFLFALTAVGEIAGAACNGRLAPHFGASRLLTIAVIGCFIASVSLLTFAWLGVQSVAVCTICVVISNFCAGIIMPNATYRALKDLGSVAGSAAALLRSLQMIAGACAAAAVGFVGGNHIEAMALIMAVFATIAFVLLNIATRRSARISLVVGES